MTHTPAPALTAEEACTVARFDASVTPPEVVAAGERVAALRFQLTDALWSHGVWAFNGTQIACGCDHYFRSSAAHREHLADALTPTLAAAAIAALEPSPAEEAVKRVEALAAAWFRDGSAPVQAIQLRRALASPAPEPQGSELAKHRRGDGLSSHLCSYCVKPWPCPTVDEATYGPGGWAGAR